MLTVVQATPRIQKQACSATDNLNPDFSLRIEPGAACQVQLDNQMMSRLQQSGANYNPG